MGSGKSWWTSLSACVAGCALLAGCGGSSGGGAGGGAGTSFVPPPSTPTTATLVAPSGAACGDWWPLHFINPTSLQSVYARDLTMCVDPDDENVYVSLSDDTDVVWVITAPAGAEPQGGITEDRILGPSFRAVIDQEYTDPGVIVEPGDSLTISASFENFRVELASAQVEATWVGTKVLAESLVDVGIAASARAFTDESTRGKAVNVCLVTAFQHAADIARDPDPTAALQGLWSTSTVFGALPCLTGLQRAFSEPDPIGELPSVDLNPGVVAEQESKVSEFFDTLLDHLGDVLPKLAH